MSRTISLEVAFGLFLTGAFLFQTSIQCAENEFKCLNGKCILLNYLCDTGNHCGDRSDEQVCDLFPCHPSVFQCLNKKCITRRWFCHSSDFCGDNSNNRYCNIGSSVQCPPGWTRCPSGTRCIPLNFVCDGTNQCGNQSEEINCASTVPCPLGWIRCPDGKRCIPFHFVCDGTQQCDGKSEEENCGNKTAIVQTNVTLRSPDDVDGKSKLKSWLLGRRRPGSGTDRWGSQVHRIAVALHLADESTFGPGSRTGEEIRWELTTQLLHRLGKDKRMSSQELALHVHALLVSCVDPRDFYGEDLVRELRGRVEASGNYTNPFLILVLCNAGDTMTTKDVDRVTAAHDSQHRPFWTDFQALSAMALSCISSSPKGVSVDERVLKDMLQELKRRQFRNGTVDNPRTTALVAQALFIHDSYKKDFDMEAATKVLVDGLNGSRSVLDSYYALPVLNRKSLLNVTSGHCKKEPVAEEEEALQRALSVSGETMVVHYSVWMGEEINVGRTWRLRMRVNSTIYDAIETAAKIDNRQRVQYSVVDGKPYVAALNGKEDDPEMGLLWFVYLKTLGSDKGPMIVEESPVDVILQPNQEIILWYKRGPWTTQSHVKKSVTPD